METQNKGARTRLEIVRHAAPLFNQHGYEGTSLSDLMGATGLKKGGIYRHFSSKEELALDAFDYAWGHAVAGRLEGVREVADCLDRLKKMVDNFVEKRAGLVPGGCPLLNTAIDADDGNAALRSRAKIAMQWWTNRISGVVSEGIHKRQIDPHVNPRKLSQVMIGCLEGALMISRIQATDAPLQNAREHLHRYLEQNIRATGAKSKRVRAS
jgi:TetR/AcrR family transcriptional repressor of nem operon